MSDKFIALIESCTNGSDTMAKGSYLFKLKLLLYVMEIFLQFGQSRRLLNYP